MLLVLFTIIFLLGVRSVRILITMIKILLLLKIRSNYFFACHSNFAKGPTQVQFITLRRVCDMGCKGLILSRGRCRYNSLQYGRTEMGERVT